MGSKSRVSKANRKLGQVRDLAVRQSRWQVPLVLAVAIVVLVVGLAAIYPRSRTGMPKRSTLPSQSVARSTGGAPEVRVTLSELADGLAKFYEHVPSDGGRGTRFFIIRGSDGVHRAALDACETCYHARQGYVQDGQKMLCRKCGNSYLPALIDHSPGGCHPIALPRRVEGDQLVVSTVEVETIDARYAARAAASQPVKQQRT